MGSFHRIKTRLHRKREGIKMDSKIFEMNSSGGMVEINSSKYNGILPGQLIQLNGYSCPVFVIFQNLGTDEHWKGYGDRYNCINIETYNYQRYSAYELKHISEKKDDRIQTYILDETLDQETLEELKTKALEVDRERAKTAAVAAAVYKEKLDRGANLFKRFISDTCPALIVAEHDEDGSDLISDYHGHTTLNRVILAVSKHTKNNFKEMRNAAANLDETAHLESAPPEAEHRQNYSMGGGYFLKDSSRHSSGWKIRKYQKYGDTWTEDLFISIAERCLF